MRFSVLGPITVCEDGSLLAAGGWKQRAVLALLLVNANRTISADRIVTEIWGDEADAGARDALYTYVSNLRGVLGKERLQRDAAGYRLVADDAELDALAFEAKLDESRRLLRSAPDRAFARVEEALTMWRGRAFDGHEDLPSIAPEAQRLDDTRTSARELAFEARLLSGESPDPADIAALCEQNPLRERPWALLMRAQYRAGRQAEALRTFQKFRGNLGTELGIEPSPALSLLEEQILLQDPALDASQATPSNLPIPITSFIGRLEEQALLDQAIQDHRLVTVLGPGGAGKTRLAMETARSLINSFPDGVWLIDLARVTNETAVIDAVVSALGLASNEGLVDWLSARTSLIVLDNCEHVAAAAGELAQRILEGTANTRIVATSRVALNRLGEHRLPLLGLESGQEDAEAAELFRERAGAVAGHLDLEDPAVLPICQQLDGLPLAIELAASRADVLSLAEIGSYIGDSLDFLTGDHGARDIHRSLEAAISWSVSLLDERRQRLFESLGVFEGPFTARAAAAVFDVGEAIQAVEELKVLSDASLVVALPGGDQLTTYRLLEPIKAFTRSRLEHADEWDRVTERHDLHYLDMCRSHREDLFGDARREVVDQTRIEMAEYLAAWDRVEDRQPVAALPFVWLLGHECLGSQIGMTYDRMVRTIGAVEEGASVDFADALTIGSWVGMYVNDWERAVPWADRAVEIYKQAGDQKGLASAHTRRGHWAFGRGDIPTAMESLSESLAICDQIGFEEGKAWPLVLIAQARRWGDDESEEVLEMLRAARGLFEATGDYVGQVHTGMVIGTITGLPIPERLAAADRMVVAAEALGGDNTQMPTALHNLAYATWDAGEHERAKGLNRACVRAALASGNLITLGLGLLQGARFAGLEGDAERCALLRGAGSAHFAFEITPFQLRYEAPAIEAAKEVLGEGRFGELLEKGGRLSPEEAAALILS